MHVNSIHIMVRVNDRTIIKFVYPQYTIQFNSWELSYLNQRTMGTN